MCIAEQTFASALKVVQVHTLRILAGGTVLFWGALWITAKQPVSAFPPEVTAFTATMSTTAYASSSASDTVNELYARRRDRSFVHDIYTTAPDGSKGVGREIFDVRRLQVIHMEPFTRSITTNTYTLQELSEALNNMQSENCPAALPAGPSKSFFGHTAVRDMQVFGSIATESWIIPDLRCFTVKQHDQFPTGSHTELLVTSLLIGDPPADLFETKPGYTERSPRELEDTFSSKYPGRQFYGPKLAERLEAKYRRDLLRH